MSCRCIELSKHPPKEPTLIDGHDLIPGLKAFFLRRYRTDAYEVAVLTKHLHLECVVVDPRGFRSRASCILAIALNQNPCPRAG
jgi:hypothetical protein